MSEHEQNQSDGAAYQEASEPKENWGSPDSQLDKDGFVRTDEERKAEGLGQFVADVVNTREAARYNDPEIGFSSVITSRDRLGEVLEGREQRLVRAATRRDMDEYDIDWQMEHAAQRAYSESPTPENQEALMRLERERTWQNTRNSGNWVSRVDSFDAKRIEGLFKENSHHERKADSDVHELLDLNTEGLSGLSVETFVELMDQRTGLKEKIRVAKQVIWDHQKTLDRIAKKIEGRQKPLRVGGGQTEHFDGADDVMNEIVGVSRYGIKQGIDSGDTVINADFDQINQLLSNSFDISPKEYLEGCQEITQRMVLRIQVKLSELEQSLKDFDERMKVGAFAENEAKPDE